ncbi:MMS19 nucleotide excision repair protein homolog [Dioscorea cayenensis subsp. rotundata]|uniref:MMS19 nucleotide excision repair protein n=1 Tax=Dioscorea cayennensis subsp. rotundata TaxID=55577 RepID=A0AB40B635_DIOCR|nr:MMS19 nucleotide excision repair protein homolog [Dioscorea cayenensis subsp. rotundata]
MPFAINVWKLMENTGAFSANSKNQVVLDAIMMTMKIVVSGCTEENQSLIVQKGYSVLLSTLSLISAKQRAAFPAFNLEGFGFVPNLVSLACKDEWLISLFSSVLIALRPQTIIPDVKLILKLLMLLLLQGHVPATQALASAVNKWPENNNETQGSNVCSFEEAIDLIFEMDLSGLLYSCPFKKLRDLISSEEICSLFCSNDRNPFIIHALEGLAWIGKGLLMRGHEKVKEIVMLFMKCLLLNQDEIITTLQDGSADQFSFLTGLAADAFRVLLCDSDVCLDKKFHATIKPLHKQRFFSSILVVLLSSIKGSGSWRTRAVLYRAFGHVISNTPLAAVIVQANQILPPLLDALSVLSSDVMDKDLIYSLLMALSGILMDDNGKEAVLNNVHSIIGRLIGLISYPHMMIVRETAIQCLVAMSGLPHARIYPMRSQVLRAVSNALDDHRRAVRLEAVRCRQAWASIASRSLHF